METNVGATLVVARNASVSEIFCEAVGAPFSGFWMSRKSPVARDLKRVSFEGVSGDHKGRRYGISQPK
jgi:hypothetical protein